MQFVYSESPIVLGFGWLKGAVHFPGSSLGRLAIGKLVTAAADHQPSIAVCVLPMFFFWRNSAHSYLLSNLMRVWEVERRLQNRSDINSLRQSLASCNYFLSEFPGAIILFKHGNYDNSATVNNSSL